MDLPLPSGPMFRPRDPLAIAVGNASLLGVGYLVLGRRRLAAATAAGTVLLVVLLVTVAPAVWFEAVVVVWWAGLVGHGWVLAGRRTPGVALRRQRLIALAMTVPVLVVLGLLRFDAYQTGQAVTGARLRGDCALATAALDRVWLGQRVADAPLTADGDATRQVCQRLAAARHDLTTALNTGGTKPLRAGFGVLSSVLAGQPGHQAMVGTVLDGFLRQLPTASACHTAAVTDWLRHRHPSHDLLDRSAAAVPRTAPAALVGCADNRMTAGDLTAARNRYQQLLDQYPHHVLAARATRGLRAATLAIELANVRALVNPATGTPPAYCSHPARYSGAPAYRKGTNRALFYGNDAYTGRLPRGWRATDPTNAVLVVCAGAAGYGTAVQTCPYENHLLPDFPIEVTFHDIAIPLKAYELRTGRLVASTTVQIGGASCPDTLSYTNYTTFDTGPPSDVYVSATAANVSAAFARLITP
jgi:hypothetical protein